MRKEMIARYPELTIDEIQSLIAQKKPHVDFSDRINPYNGDEEWHDRVKNLWWSREYDGKVEGRCEPVLALKPLLLAQGGCEACLPAIEEDLSSIINSGQLWDDLTTKMMRGIPGQCHRNSCNLWCANRESWQNCGFAVIICTGYALSEDGFWRQHSWLVQAKPRANVLIETTAPRVAYFGFGMPYDMAEKFAYQNY